MKKGRACLASSELSTCTFQVLKFFRLDADGCLPMDLLLENSRLCRRKFNLDGHVEEF